MTRVISLSNFIRPSFLICTLLWQGCLVQSKPTPNTTPQPQNESIAHETAETEFAGWQGMRVIHMPDVPPMLATVKVSGKQHLVLPNPRQSRLDFFYWSVDSGARKSTPAASRNPNELPMAEEVQSHEFPMDQLPREVLALPANNSKEETEKLLVLSGPPWKITLLRNKGLDSWEIEHTWDLLPGRPSGSPALLLNSIAEDHRQLLIGFDEGIQVLNPDKKELPRWHQPMEKIARRQWWLKDIDGSGKSSLIEWSRSAQQGIRMHKRAEDGTFLPPLTISEKSWHNMDILEIEGQPAQIFLMPGSPVGVLRRYQLETGEPDEFGISYPLSWSRGTETWTGLEIDGTPHWVGIAANPARLEVLSLEENGNWRYRDNFPALARTRVLVRDPRQENTLLLWVEGGSELYSTQWQNQRFTFPKLIHEEPQGTEARILALEPLDDLVWATRRLDQDIELRIWKKDQQEPEVRLFQGLGKQVEKARWAGGNSLIFQESFSRNLKTAHLQEDGTTLIREPSSLKQTKIEDFKTFVIDSEIQIGRLSEGVWQWLDEEWQPREQIMLPDGLSLLSYLPISHGKALAIDSSGIILHQLEADESGVFRSQKRRTISPSQSLSSDATLGLFLIRSESIERLTDGAAYDLDLKESMDGRVSRLSGIRENTIHRIQAIDITGDGRDDLLLFDDQKATLSVLHYTEEGMQPLISWQVFEDESYPYGSRRKETREEPRLVHAMDFDGDSHQDLILIAQDRLIIYLSRESKSE